MKLFALLLAVLVVGSACRRAAEETPELGACKRGCNETYRSCMTACPEPVACGARCEKDNVRCLDRCATPPSP